jgi:hypothetical protein
LFIIGSHPLVRVRPIVPMRYTSLGWDFGWLMVRSDGHVVYRRCDPYTLKFSDHVSHRAIRWFVLERRSSVGRMSPILAQPVATIAGPLRPFDQPTRDRAVFGHVERKPLRTLACARHFLDAMPDAAADAVHSAGDGP